MPLYRDQVTRLSIKQIRAAFTPKAFASMTRVHLEQGIHVADVEIVVVAEPLCFGGTKRWLRCPRCGVLCGVVGCSSVLGFGCSRCLGWRGREHRLKWARVPEPKMEPVVSGCVG